MSSQKSHNLPADVTNNNIEDDTVLYLIYAEDVANTLEQRLAARPAHLARMQLLKDADRLVLAGPNPIADSEDPGSAGFSGSVIIADFPNLEEAKAWASKDPYIEAGVYQNVTVKPFKRVF
ncbi:YciI-like protein [Pragia fontium]|uniref:YCII-related domain-containing protein n=2 Tax=Pragia fontium TaxID=82985 RepID=A0AAJ5BHW3_9GAMM|nr:hypothetical protein SAMN02745723_10872 [Pragia fontium DSM 5563 = ATCC 49100]SUB82900.1 YciI-like protein [Pragia fontium]